MQTYHFFKVNLASQGYKIIWSEDTPPLDLGLETIDNSLSHPTTSGSSPNVSYSAAKLDRTHILLSIGSYWAEHHDEYGRPGLFFWHGVVCILPEIDIEEVERISDLLVHLIYKYINEYDRFGRIIANLAIQEQNKGLISTFTQLTQQEPPKLDKIWEDAIDKFINNLSRVPTSANLRMESSSHYKLMAPFLVCLLLYQDDVLHVAGGNLTQVNLEQFPYISVPSQISGYREFDISKILQGISESSAITSDSNQFQAETDILHQERTGSELSNKGRKYILLVIGAFLILCVSAIFIFNRLNPQISPTSIPLTVTTTFTPKTNIAVTVEPLPELLPSSTPAWTPTATNPITPSEMSPIPLLEPTIPSICQGIVNAEENYYIIRPGDTFLKISEAVYGSREMYEVIYNSNVERSNPSVKSINNITAGGCLLIP